MGVGRIIVLIVIIGVVENQSASDANGESSCGDFKGKYVFVLEPAENQIDLLTDFVKLTQSAIVKRPGIGGNAVEIIISPEDFTEFEKKSRALKVYRSHSLQCINKTANIAIVESNTSRRALEQIELSGKITENSFFKVTTPLVPKTTQELDNKMCTSSNVCKPKSNNNLINASLTNFVKILLESTATPSTNFGDSLSSRIVRASKQKKGMSKQKSKKAKTARNFSKEKTRAKLKEQKKSVKGTNGSRSWKKLTKADVPNKKTTSIPAPKTSTQESWNKLMSMAAKSLTKSNSMYTKSRPHKVVTISKLLSSGKLISDAQKSANKEKQTSTKAKKRPKKKNMRKSAAKMSTTAKKQIKFLNTRNRVNQQRKSLPKSLGRKKSSPAINPKARKKIEAKNRKSNRDKRELTISAETACIKDNSKKRSLDRLAKRDFSFHAPGGCTVIKISTSCDDDCSKDNSETLGPPLAFDHELSSSQLFVPSEVPNGSMPDFLVPSPVHPNQEVPDSASLLFQQNKNPNIGPSEGDASSLQPLPSISLSPDYESQEGDPFKPESMDQNGSPEYIPSDIIPPFLGTPTIQNPSNWFAHDPVIPENIFDIKPVSSATSSEPFEVPVGVEEDVYDNLDEINYEEDDGIGYDEVEDISQDKNDAIGYDEVEEISKDKNDEIFYDEDNETIYDNDGKAHDEKENYEELEGYEEEITTEIPTISLAPLPPLTNLDDITLMSLPKENIMDSIGNLGNEDSYEDKDDAEDNSQDYAKDSGNAEINYEDDYSADD